MPVQKKMVRIKAFLSRRGYFRYQKLSNSSSSGQGGCSSNRSSKWKGLIKLTASFSCGLRHLQLHHHHHQHHHHEQQKQQKKLEVPRDVHKGSFAVYVGPEHKRFVLKTCYLAHPAFGALLQKSAEEFGYDYDGGLVIPCPVAVFEYLLFLVKKKSDPSFATSQVKNLIQQQQQQYQQQQQQNSYQQQQQQNSYQQQQQQNSYQQQQQQH